MSLHLDGAPEQSIEPNFSFWSANIELRDFRPRFTFIFMADFNVSVSGERKKRPPLETVFK